MVEKNEKTIYLDPRIVLLLLVFVTVVVFSQHSLYIELVLVTALLGLFLCCSLFKSGLKFVLVFGFLLTLQSYLPLSGSLGAPRRQRARCQPNAYTASVVNGF